jgi:sulfopropanediol 3-dehydrogenase
MTTPPPSGGHTVQYLKSPGPPAPEVNADVAKRVETMLADIERGGLEAVRRWSRELDGWDPPSFLATEQEFERAAATLDPEL